MNDGTNREDIYPGLEVDIVLKKDQPTGKLTHGKVKDILTSSSQHHRGIKVRLEDGQVGRVQKIYNGNEEEDEDDFDNFV
ncbi:MAG: YwbE family protein [Patescibacteria group bacterium]